MVADMFSTEILLQRPEKTSSDEGGVCTGPICRETFFDKLVNTPTGNDFEDDGARAQRIENMLVMSGAAESGDDGIRALESSMRWMMGTRPRSRAQSRSLCAQIFNLERYEEFVVHDLF